MPRRILPGHFPKGGANTKQKLIPILGAALVFLLALGITLYPLVSNWYNARHQSLIHTQYTQIIEQVNDSDLILAKDLATAYNASITPGAQLVDAFSQDSLEDASEDYAYLLNMAGDSIMGYIEIPLIRVNLPIYHGTDADTLGAGIGHLLGSSLPVGGAGTHCVLTGHSGMASQKLFSDLDQLKLGDVFYLNVLNETLAYQVDAINTVLPHDTTYLGIEEGKDYCTLITCTPFGVNTHRLLVRGSRIPYEEAEVLVEEQLQTEEIPVSTWEQEYIKSILISLCLVLFAAIVAIIVVCRKQLRRTLCRRKKGKYESR